MDKAPREISSGAGTSPAKDDARKLRVFISYSRKDLAFAEHLLASLDTLGFAPSIDKSSIAAAEDWQVRIGDLIAKTDTVVFVITPDSLASHVCAWEVDETFRRGKRLIPILQRAVDNNLVPERMRALNYVDFDGQAFDTALKTLDGALTTDLVWIREHTRLGELAERWQARNRADELLLRGQELADAQAWAARRPTNAPEISDTQRALFVASADAEVARNVAEAKRLADMAAAQSARARFQKRAGRLLWAVAAVMLAALVNVLWQENQVTRREQLVFAALSAKVYEEQQFDRGMRYTLQAYPPKGAAPWAPFSTALEGKLAGGAIMTRMLAQLRGHTGSVLFAAFSPDGKRVVTPLNDGTARVWDAESGNEIALLSAREGGAVSANWSPDGRRIVTAGRDKVARIWDVDWVLVHGATLRERVCTEILIGAQEFTPYELTDPVLADIDPSDPVARNPCLHRGPLSLDYWTRLPGQWGRWAVRHLALH